LHDGTICVCSSTGFAVFNPRRKVWPEIARFAESLYAEFPKTSKTERIYNDASSSPKEGSTSEYKDEQKNDQITNMNGQLELLRLELKKEQKQKKAGLEMMQEEEAASKNLQKMQMAQVDKLIGYHQDKRTQEIQGEIRYMKDILVSALRGNAPDPALE